MRPRYDGAVTIAPLRVVADRRRKRHAGQRHAPPAHAAKQNIPRGHVVVDAAIEHIEDSEAGSPRKLLPVVGRLQAGRTEVGLWEQHVLRLSGNIADPRFGNDIPQKGIAGRGIFNGRAQAAEVAAAPSR